MTSQLLTPAAVASRAGGHAHGSAPNPDIYNVFNFGTHPGAAPAPLLPQADAPAPPNQAGRGGQAFQGLREAALQPWQQEQAGMQGADGGSPQHPGVAAMLASPLGARQGGNGEGTAWAASLFASPPAGSSAHQASAPPLPQPKQEATRSSWLTSLLQQAVRASSAPSTAPLQPDVITCQMHRLSTAPHIMHWMLTSSAALFCYYSSHR